MAAQYVSGLKLVWLLKFGGKNDKSMLPTDQSYALSIWTVYIWTV